MVQNPRHGHPEIAYGAAIVKDLYTCGAAEWPQLKKVEGFKQNFKNESDEQNRFQQRRILTTASPFKNHRGQNDTYHWSNRKRRNGSHQETIRRQTTHPSIRSQSHAGKAYHTTGSRARGRRVRAAEDILALAGRSGVSLYSDNLHIGS